LPQPARPFSPRLDSLACAVLREFRVRRVAQV